MDLSGIPTFEAPTLQDFDMNGISEGQRIGGNKKRQAVRFYTKEFREFTIKVDENDKPLLKNGKVQKELVSVVREMVEVVTPGDKNIFHDFATDYHRREFWPQYTAFRDGKTAPIGMPVEECDWISPGIATELKYLGCHTREQLADGSDALCNQIPNGWELRDYAKAICEAEGHESKGQEVSALRSQVLLQNQIIADLQRSQEELAETLKSLSAPQEVQTAQVKTRNRSKTQEA